MRRMTFSATIGSDEDMLSLSELEDDRGRGDDAADAINVEARFDGEKAVAGLTPASSTAKSTSTREQGWVWEEALWRLLLVAGIIMTTSRGICWDNRKVAPAKVSRAQNLVAHMLQERML